MRAPKNLFPTAANPMNFDRRGQNIVGHWSSTSRTPDRYDRSVCANVRRLRNTIVRKISDDWEPVPSFHIPCTVTDQLRVGKCAVTERWSETIPGVSNAESEEVFDGETQTSAQANTEVDATQPLLVDAVNGRNTSRNYSIRRCWHWVLSGVGNAQCVYRHASYTSISRLSEQILEPDGSFPTLKINPRRVIGAPLFISFETRRLRPIARTRLQAVGFNIV